MSETKKKIYVVEANPQRRSFYQSLLQQLPDFSVKIFLAGKDLVELLDQDPDNNTCSLVVLDWQLEDMPGYVLVQKLRERPALSQTDFLVVSNVVTEEDLVLLCEMDIYHKLHTGASGQEVIGKIKEIMSIQNEIDPQLKDALGKLADAVKQENLEECDRILNLPGMDVLLSKNLRFGNLKGEVLILKKDFEIAIDAMSSLLKLHENKPGSLKIMSTLGKAYCMSGNHDKAIEIFEKLSEKSPKNLGHQVSLGDCYINSNDADKAKEKYDQVLAADPTNKQAQVGEAKVAMSKENFDEASSIFAKIPTPFESYSLASFFNNRGVAMSRSGKMREAVQFYRNALPFLQRYKAHIQFNLGLAHAKAGEKEEAKKAFEEAIKSGGQEFVAKKNILKKLSDNSSSLDDFLDSQTTGKSD